MMTSELPAAFALLIVFHFKHFFADFPLQRDFMLRKKVSPNWDFFWPLSFHCGIHAGLTLLIVLLFKPQLWWLAGVDFIAHFVMDRIKSGPRYLGRFNDRSKSAYWNAFGFDQMFHHLTHLYIVWVLVTH